MSIISKLKETAICLRAGRVAGGGIAPRRERLDSSLVAPAVEHGVGRDERRQRTTSRSQLERRRTRTGALAPGEGDPLLLGHEGREHVERRRLARPGAARDHDADPRRHARCRCAAGCKRAKGFRAPVPSAAPGRNNVSATSSIRRAPASPRGSRSRRRTRSSRDARRRRGSPGERCRSCQRETAGGRGTARDVRPGRRSASGPARSDAADRLQPADRQPARRGCTRAGARRGAASSAPPARSRDGPGRRSGSTPNRECGRCC